MSFYNSVTNNIHVNPELKGIKKLRWYLHEYVHKLIYSFFGNKFQLLWDVLDNDIKLIPFYKEYYKNTPSIYLGGETETTSHTYYYYRIKFSHTCIDPSQPIIFYNAYGQHIYTLAPNYQYMNYGTGILSVPGSEKNNDIESVSTATYYVYYDTDDLIIDYDTTEFYIKKALIKTPAASVITATFEYYTIMTAIKDIASVIDGKYDTQVQTIFTSEPPSNYNYAILDLGAECTIQALDILSGFFYPDEDHNRKYDIGMTLSIRYSLDGETYYNISDNTESFDMSGGETKSFEESDLGTDFSARYLKLVLQDVEEIDYSSIQITISDSNRDYYITQGIIDDDTDNGTIVVLDSGCWVTAFTEIAAYSNIINKSIAYLIPTTYLTTVIDLDSLTSGEYPNTIYVESTKGFDLDSGETIKIAYIVNDDLETFDSFTYTGITDTSFTGVSGLSSNHLVRTSSSELYGMVVSEIESDLSLYDYNGLLPKMGDRVYKINKVSDDYVYTKEQNDYLAKYYLKEVYKNHTKINVSTLYAPHLQVGKTIEVIDTYNNTNRNYFIESIEDNSGTCNLVLAYYP
jgi:hypothetical protein